MTMNRSATLHSLLSILFTWSTAAAQSPTPRLLVDTDLRPAAVVPPSAQGFLNLGAYTYFAATDALHGREVLEPDGLRRARDDERDEQHGERRERRGEARAPAARARQSG